MSKTTITKQVPVIAIDGPSGSGKGTVSRLLAEQLGWHFLDSGALYRLLGLKALESGTKMDDYQALAGLAVNLDVRFESSSTSNSTRFMLEGVDVTDTIREERVGNAASQVAVVPEVRKALLERQHACRKQPGLVADGRDMGTVVFPSAELKIFLTASQEERAKRRYKQLNEKGMDAMLPELLSGIIARDERDANRATAPLMAAEDAIIIDTTDIGIDEVVDHIISLWRSSATS